MALSLGYAQNQVQLGNFGAKIDKGSSAFQQGTALLAAPSQYGYVAISWLERRRVMPGTGEERRGFPRFPLVLAAEMIELPAGSTKLLARSSDVSSSGCYIDTMNPFRMGVLVRLRLTHHEEIFEVKCQVVYVSPRLGMGLRFHEMGNEQRERLRGWLAERKEH